MFTENKRVYIPNKMHIHIIDHEIQLATNKGLHISGQADDQP